MRTPTFRPAPPIALATVAALLGLVVGAAGCGGSDDDERRPPYGSLGTTALCNDGTFSFETDCARICEASGVKTWYVNCGQEGTGPTSPMNAPSP